jgi:hypothetical protein
LGGCRPRSPWTGRRLVLLHRDVQLSSVADLADSHPRWWAGQRLGRQRAYWSGFGAVSVALAVIIIGLTGSVLAITPARRSRAPTDDPDDPSTQALRALHHPGRLNRGTSCEHDADSENGGIAGRETSIVLPGTRCLRPSRGWCCTASGHAGRIVSGPCDGCLASRAAASTPSITLPQGFRNFVDAAVSS